MKILVPANNKGGVGKTKISILLAEYMSTYLNKRVLAIDFDPQCNFSQRFLTMEIDPSAPEGRMPPIHPDYNPDDPDDMNWDGRSSIADIFRGKPIIPYPTNIKNLDISPANAYKLLEAEQVSKSEVVDKVHKQLRLLLEAEEFSDNYDIVIIDTAPSKGPLTVSAIKAATHMLIPSQMEEAPIQGVYGMLQLWMQESMERNPNRPLKLIGILPNMVRPIIYHRDMLASLLDNKEIAQYVMPMKLGQRTALAEVDAAGAAPKTVFDLPDSKLDKQEALAVCEYISKKVFNYE